MYKCKKCGYQFSEQTMFNKLLTPNTRQKLTDMVKPNQSASDVFEELITAALSQEIKDKLETFRKHPRETPEDLINSLLDELEAIQKELERIEVVRKQIEPPDNLDDALTLIAILTYDKEELKKQLNNKEN